MITGRSPCLSAFQRPSCAEDFFLCLLADRAGVDQDDVGLFGHFRQFQAFGLGEHVGHLGRVVLVHLAPVGLDIELAAGAAGHGLRLPGRGISAGAGAGVSTVGVARESTAGVPGMAIIPDGWRAGGR